MTISVDDGCASDIRIADLAQKYEIEVIFYWPVEWHSLAYEKGYQPLSYAEAYEIAKSFEIGSHGVTHGHLTQMPREIAESEIADSKFMLQSLFDRNVKKFCPSRGYTNDELTEFTMNFYESQRLTKGRGLIHIHPNSGANNNVPWREVYNRIKDEVDDIELWGHSWEWDKYGMWDEIEDFLKEYHGQVSNR